MTPKANEANLLAIAWQLELARDLERRLDQRTEEISAMVQRREDDIQAMAERLPPEIRFMDAAARSRLASRLSEMLLDARLELAAQEKLLEILTVRAAKPSPMV